MTSAMIAIVLMLLLPLARETYGHDVDYCFVYEDEPYVYMGTKTAYDFAHSGRKRFQVVPNCQPEQVWMFAAHGISYPTMNEIAKMQSLAELRNQIVHNHETRQNGRLCNEDLENLKIWKLHDRMSTPEVLTEQGREDMRLLARRLQSNFREILLPISQEITSTNYKFKSIGKQNSRASMDAFMESMFASKSAIMPEETAENDTLLTTYKTCSAWSNKEDQTAGNDELAKFDKSALFKNLVYRVSRRLGFLYNISSNSILTMYDTCRYEKAWHIAHLPPWCAVFSKDELRILEFREDLHYYYSAGYGREINTLLGCPLLQDMMNHFRKLEGSNFAEQPRGIFYFSDVMSLLNLLTTMGIAKDQTPLTHSNYYEMTRRQWRTSMISSFGSNLVAVFYKCSDSGRPYKVMFYLSEEPLLLDGCEVGLCDWEFLKNKYSGFFPECKVQHLCWDSSGAEANYTLTYFMLILSVVVSVNLFRQ